MKCPNCGYNLTIDHERCPYCGNANPFAEKHRREMRRFKRDYNKTKEDVMHESKKVNAWTVKVALIAVLVALNIGLLFVYENAYSIYGMYNAARIESNYPEHKTRLDEMEENRQYIALAEYWQSYELNDSDILDEYNAVYRVCSAYSMVYRYTMRLATHEETYTSVENQLEILVGYAEDVYNISKPSEYYLETRYQQKHQACMDDAVKQMEDLLQVYFNLTDEEIESFSELNQARRQIMLEEGLERNE